MSTQLLKKNPQKKWPFSRERERESKIDRQIDFGVCHSNINKKGTKKCHKMYERNLKKFPLAQKRKQDKMKRWT